MVLEDAITEALTTNTSEALNTLKVLDANKYPFMIGSNLVCVPPFEKTKDEVSIFYQRTRYALLETIEGADCLWILEASMAEAKQAGQ